jgi:hypothetical protein
MCRRISERGSFTQVIEDILQLGRPGYDRSDT